MIQDNVEALMSRPVSFLNAECKESEIAVSTRIRLARNIAGHRFPSAADDEELREICDTVCTAAENTAAFGAQDALSFNAEQLDETDRNILLDRRRVSREFFANLPGRKVLVCPQEACSLMINEEDQLRLQVLRPGLQLGEVWQEINRLDDQISGALEYAFDPQLGYLTSCPTNLGTGLRASVMLHLPALVLSGQMDATLKGLSKLRIEVRGLFGELSEKAGNLFQISNQTTLGESEAHIISYLERVVKLLIDCERRTRRELLRSNRIQLFDQIGRAYGKLRYSYILGSKEVLDCLSGLRLGVDLGLFQEVNTGKVNAMFIETLDGHICKRAGKPLSAEECNILRATYCREKLRQLN